MNLLKAQVAKEKGTNPKKKTRASDDESSGDESVHVMEQEVSQLYAATINSAKRQKLTQRTTEVIVEITDRKGLRRVLRVLLDTGTSASIILAKFTSPDSTSSKLIRPLHGQPWEEISLPDASL